MIFTYNGQRQEQAGNLQYGSYFLYSAQAKTVSLADILACCISNGEKLDSLLARKNGFRRDKPSRKDLMEQNQLILNELRAVKKEIRQNRSPGGRTDGA